MRVEGIGYRFLAAPPGEGAELAEKMRSRNALVPTTAIAPRRLASRGTRAEGSLPKPRRGSGACPRCRCITMPLRAWRVKPKRTPSFAQQGSCSGTPARSRSTVKQT